MSDPRWQTVRRYVETARSSAFSEDWIPEQREARAALDSLEAEMDILATDYWDAENRAGKAEAEMEQLQNRLRDAPLGGDGSHWEDCWRSHIDCARARVEKAEAEIERLREALRTFLDSMGVEFDDPRMKYVVMQVGRRDLEAARAALGGEE